MNLSTPTPTINHTNGVNVFKQSGRVTLGYPGEICDYDDSMEEYSPELKNYKMQINILDSKIREYKFMKRSHSLKTF